MVDDSRLKKKLRAVPQKIVDAVKAQMEVHAAQMVAEMRMLAPVLQTPDKRRTPGALRDSIGWTWGDAPKGSLQIATVRGRAVTGIYITIYAGTRDKKLGTSDAFYARWQEFGTKNMPANPFFFVVWRANRRRVRSSISRTVRKALKTI